MTRHALRSRRWCMAALTVLVAIAWPTSGLPHEPRPNERLSKIGPAPNHTFLTSVIDQGGTLRIQYLGVRFDPDELLRDLRSVLVEGRSR